MNILTLCLSPNKGGLELYALRSMHYFKVRDTSLECSMATSPDSAIASELDKNGIEFLKVRPLVRFLPLISAWRLSRWIKRNKIDIVHIHWNRDLKLAALTKWLARDKFTLVYSRHMGITRSKKDWFHRMLYSQVDCLITHTRLMQQEALTRLPLPAEKVKMIYLGTPEPEKIDNDVCAELQNNTCLQGGALKVGLFGRIEYGKGQHLLIEAVNKLQQSGSDVRAGLIGHTMDEEYFQEIQNMADEYGVSDKVHFFGFKNQASKYMTCFDVVVLTTYNETFGLVLIEAMRSGVAVIGSNAGGVPEIITDNESGLLFETGSAKSLSEALQRVYSDRTLLASLADTGKSVADKSFSEQEHFKKLISIFRECSS